MCVVVQGARRGLQVFVDHLTWGPAPKSGSSGRTASDCWAVSPAQSKCFNQTPSFQSWVPSRQEAPQTHLLFTPDCQRRTAHAWRTGGSAPAWRTGGAAPTWRTGGSAHAWRTGGVAHAWRTGGSFTYMPGKQVGAAPVWRTGGRNNKLSCFGWCQERTGDCCFGWDTVI